MNIAIDAHCLGAHMTGNETYVLNLVRGLAAMDAENRYHILASDLEAVLGEIGNAPNISVQSMRPNWAPLRIPFVVPSLLHRLRAHLLHVTYVAPPVSPCPTVVTVHDISYELFPEFFSPRDRWGLSLLVPWSVRRAAKVIAISENTKRDLMRVYKLNGDKVVVTHLAASKEFHPVHQGDELARVRRKYGLPVPYVLSLGNLQPRKNLKRLIEAYSLLRQQGRITHLLAIVGQAHFKASEVFRLVQQKGLQQQVVFTGYVPDEDLVLLYNAADLFVFPSLYEGFGLPVLEAMACGTAVISSNAASLPEVAGDAAILVDPYDVEGLARAIVQVISDAQLRRSLAERGLSRASQFSWEETARRTRHLYEEVLAG